MFDISYGLSSELFHICKSSDRGCFIYEEKIPIHKNTEKMGEEFRIYPAIAALNGGEDYELLFTVPVSQYEIIKDMKDISIIGHITDKSEGKKLIASDGRQIDLKAQGWNAMK
jgi:thiamine-monophosphate kinase